MADRVRRKTFPQAAEQLVNSQAGFLGGMNLDVPPSEINSTEVVRLQNYIPYRTHLETRPGVRTYAEVPGSGGIHQIFYHSKSGSIIVHRENNIYVLRPDKTWEVAVNLTFGTYPGNYISQMDSYRDGVLIFSGQILYLNVSVSPPTLRPLTQPNPVNSPDSVFEYNVGTSNSFRYRFTWTYARVENGEIVAESGTPLADTASPDWFEIRPSVAYGLNPADVVRIDPNFFFSSGDIWNRVCVYRTGNLEDAATIPEAYYLAQVIDPATGSLPGIGTMVIEGVPPFTVYSNEQFQAFSDDVIITQPLLRTRFLQPIPIASADTLGKVTPGFIFVAQKGGNEIYYSEIGQYRARAGLYNPGLQTAQIQDAIFGLASTPDTIVVCGRTGLHRGTVYSAQNVGNAEVGESVAAFIDQVVSLFDESVGVQDTSSISPTTNGGFIARCTDGSVRLFDGLSWVRDYSRRKVASELRLALEGSSSVFDPSSGSYLLWYRTDDTAPNLNKTLRLGLSEEGGVGWCYYSGTGWPAPKPGCRGISAVDTLGNRLLIVADNIHGRLVWVESYPGVGLSAARGYDYPDEPGEVPIVSQVLLREFTGASERNYLRHQQSWVFARPIPGEALGLGFFVDMTIFADGGETASASVQGVREGERAIFRGEVGGRRLQIGLSAEGAAHCISNVETVFQSRDQRTLWVSDAIRDVEEQLCSGLLLWLNRANPTTNASNPSAVNESIFETATITGPDSKPGSAIYLEVAPWA